MSLPSLRAFFLSSISLHLRRRFRWFLSEDGSAATAAEAEAGAANVENVLEERDPSYDAMLNQMVGRIKSKPGGKLEMGEVSFSVLISHFKFCK